MSGLGVESHVIQKPSLENSSEALPTPTTHSMKNKLASYIGAAFTVALAAHSAAATVSLGTATPAVGDGVQNLNFSTSTANNTNVQFVGSEYLAGDNVNKLGQSFTTGSNIDGYELSAISVRQVSWGNTSWDYTGGTVNLKVFSMNSVLNGVWSTTQLALESATVAGTGAPTFNATPGANAQWLTITLGTSLELTANTQYGFMLTASGTGGNQEFFMEIDGTSTSSYAGGFALTTGDFGLTPVWDGNNGQPSDRAFVASMTAIPEPSAALLGGLGMLVMLRRRRA